MTKPLRILASGLLFLLPVLLAGCGGSKPFQVELPTWSAGHTWEFAIERTDIARATGEFPAFLEGEIEDEDHMCTDSERIEVFNTTTRATDDTRLYVTGHLTAPGGDGERSCRGSRGWQSHFYTVNDLNPVRTSSVDLQGGIIEIREGPGREEELFRFPLTNGQSWSVSQEFEGRDVGTTKYRVVRKEMHETGAGDDLESVRLQARFDPPDRDEVEREIKTFFAAQGAKLDDFSFNMGANTVYWYAPDVEFYTDFQETESFVISASGRDEDGEKFDFTYEERNTETRRLVKYSLTELPEKSLQFVAQQLAGYKPPPITPLAHNVAEIVVSSDGLNAGDEAGPSVEFRLRVFNTTAGERRLRANESNSPVVAPADPGDSDRLQANWTFRRETEQGLVQLGGVTTGDRVTMKASQLGGPGRVYVSLVLRDIEEDVVISSDDVEFDVYWRRNITLTAAPDNATRGRVQTSFPVGYGATAIAVAVSFGDQSGHVFGRIEVADVGGNRVPPTSSSRDYFEARDLEPFKPGDWLLAYRDTPMVPQSTYTLDTWVSYKTQLRSKAEFASAT